jgi:hypothetical protein
MKAIIPFLLVAASANAMDISDWALNEIKHPDKGVVGYVYNTYAAGTEAGARTEKAVTDFRFVCSTTKAHEPVIAIRWAGWMSPSPKQYVTVDKKPLYTGEWLQEGKTVYKPVSEVKELVAAIKAGKQLSATWRGIDAVGYSVTYDISNVNSKLGNFNASCGTNI